MEEKDEDPRLASPRQWGPGRLDQKRKDLTSCNRPFDPLGDALGSIDEPAIRLSASQELNAKAADARPSSVFPGLQNFTSFGA